MSKNPSIDRSRGATIIGVILNYREASLTKRCVENLKGQGLSRIVIVDNSSSREHSDELLDAVSECRDVVVMIAERNLGFASGINKALSTLTEDESAGLALFINNDAIAKPGMLAALRDGIEGCPMTAAVAPVVAAAEDSEEKNCGFWYNKTLGLMFKSIPCGVFCLTGCCLLVDLSVFDDNKVFDERYFFYGEDVALCLDLRRRGLQYDVIPDAVVIHEVAVTSKKGSYFYEFHMVRSHMLLADDCASNQILRFVYLTARLLSLSGRSVWRGLKQRSWTPLHAFRMAVFEGRNGPENP